MSGALARIGRVAVTEWAVAVRSRRALVVTLLFLATLLCLIMGFIHPVVTASALLTPVWAMSFLCL